MKQLGQIIRYYSTDKKNWCTSWNDDSNYWIHYQEPFKTVIHQYKYDELDGSMWHLRKRSIFNWREHKEIPNPNFYLDDSFKIYPGETLYIKDEWISVCKTSPEYLSKRMYMEEYIKYIEDTKRRIKNADGVEFN